MSRANILYQIMRAVYSAVLRDLVVEAVLATNNDLDDLFLEALDALFGWEGE